MTNWWRADNELMTSWWRADDELMTSWWRADDKLMTSWWQTDDELMTSWWRADDELMTSWWRADDELMTSWWRTDDELMTNWWRTDAKPHYRTLEPISGWRGWDGMDGMGWLSLEGAIYRAPTVLINSKNWHLLKMAFFEVLGLPFSSNLDMWLVFGHGDLIFGYTSPHTPKY